MKRDPDYIVELLREFEASDDWKILDFHRINSSNDQEKRHYHLALLCDHGLLIPIGKSMYRLSAQAHDFIDALNAGGIWERTKNAVAESGGNATIEIMKSIAIAFLKKKLEDQTGLEL